MKQKNFMVIVMIFILIAVSSSVQAATFPDVQISLLNYQPQPAKAGDIVEVRLRVENIGTAEAKDLMIKAVPDYPFALLSEDDKQQTITSLPNFPERERSKTISFKFKVNKDAVEGQHEIELGYSLTKGGSWTTKKFSIDVTARQFAGIHLDKTKISPGKETEIAFTVSNQGNAPLQNLVFSWNEPTGMILPVSTDNTRYIKYVEPGESVPLKYLVLASNNAKPDLYSLEMQLQYDIGADSSNKSKTTFNTKMGIFVGGETDFDVAFSESTQGQTSLSVANIGNNPALSVTVRVPQQYAYAVQGSPSAIIGNLDKGDYTVVSFQIQPNMGGGGMRNATAQRSRDASAQQIASQNNDLKVLVEYTDTTGERRTVQKSIQMSSRAFSNFTGTGFGMRRQAQTAGSWWNSPIIWMLAILIVAGIYLYRNKELRHKILAKLMK